MSWNVKVVMGLTLAASIGVGQSHAGGLYLNEFATPSMGTAGAGGEAWAHDASTAFAFHNPAGMTRLEGHQLSLGFGLGRGETEFDANANTPFGGGNGGDAIGDVVASGMYDSDEVSLLVDMGTNGELIFGNNMWLVSCSVASGPAVEGGGVRFGMRGMRGGIEHVQIDPDSLVAKYTVIGNTRPRGICGSGIIDVAAEMFSVGILDFAGKIRADRTLSAATA